MGCDGSSFAERGHPGPGRRPRQGEGQAAKAQALAIKAQADTELTLARSEETKAKTIQTLSSVDIDERKSAIETAEKIGAAIQPQTNVVPPSTQFG